MKRYAGLLFGLVLLGFSTSSHERTYPISYKETWGICHEVVSAIDLIVRQDDLKQGIIQTDFVSVDVPIINAYIYEEPPHDKPAWDQGRYSLMIRIAKKTKKKTLVNVTAIIERFGLASELLLIPAAWTRATSNGELEEKILELISNKIIKK